MTTDEQRDWDEYFAWTRGADKSSYAETEDLAWRRLQLARLKRRQQPYGFDLDDDAIETLRANLNQPLALPAPVLIEPTDEA